MSNGLQKKASPRLKLNSVKSTQSTVQLADLTRHLGDYNKIGEVLFPVVEKMDIGQGALRQALQIDITKTYEENVQRILDCMRYDKIDDYAEGLHIARCKDGFSVNYKMNFDILNDFGMCYELASKTAAWLQIMYPEKIYRIGQDKERPSGWNHCFVLEERPDEEYFVIDPSKNRMGRLSETGEWDKSGKNYTLDELRQVHSSGNAEVVVFLRIKEKDSEGKFFILPLLSPRHFHEDSNIEPFGISLLFNTESNFPFLFVQFPKVSGEGFSLYPLISLTDLTQSLSNRGIHLPSEVVERILDMWRKIYDKGNYRFSDKTIKEYEGEFNQKN
ncbi:MAG: hypothetical protein SFU25_03955 [Candidatus Caenarcaniphilales bacterium]|nr:hypothetical protein [Candidatus Caenarcaniphilales bacterium]